MLIADSLTEGLRLDQEMANKRNSFSSAFLKDTVVDVKIVALALKLQGRGSFMLFISFQQVNDLFTDKRRTYGENKWKRVNSGFR